MSVSELLSPAKGKGNMTIQKVINRLIQETGIFVGRSRLYHYDNLGISPEIGRADNNYRQYSEDEYEIMKLIVILTDLGIGLGKIKAYVQDKEDKELLECLKKKEANLQSAIKFLNK
jgi:DNA-binding transcriptional MerR regulator